MDFTSLLHVYAGPLLMACALISAFCAGVLLGLSVHGRASSLGEGAPR